MFITLSTPPDPAEFDLFDDATEFLEDRGYKDAYVVLVRSAGDTYSGQEEIWFLDHNQRQRIASLSEDKHYDGVAKPTKVKVELGW